MLPWGNKMTNSHRICQSCKGRKYNILAKRDGRLAQIKHLPRPSRIGKENLSNNIHLLQVGCSKYQRIICE